MMQTEGTRITREDRQELERQIKALENEINTNPNLIIIRKDGKFNTPELDKKIKELRRLRRLRR